VQSAVKITVEKGGLEKVEANQWLWSVLLRGKVPCVMPQSVHQSSGERGSSNDDQVKKQAALDGAHVESFDRLCEVINKTSKIKPRLRAE